MYSIRSGEEIVLASSSPRRTEMLKECGLAHRVVPADVDETPDSVESPQSMVERLARDKALKVSELYPEAWVIGADTTVVVNGEILGKPEGEEDAFRMLNLISGRIHEVWGGLAVLCKSRAVTEIHSDVTRVRMRPLSPDAIRAYIASGEPNDKAGGYAIQGIGASLVERIEGSYTNVVGMNLSAVIQILQSNRVLELA